MQALLRFLFAAALCAARPDVSAQVLNSDDHMKLFVAERFGTEMVRICAQRGLASDSAVGSVTRLRKAHREAIIAGESLLADVLRRRGDSLERSLDQGTQPARTYLAALNGEDAVRFCRQAEAEADALARKSSAQIAIENFETELVTIEHSNGMRCSAVATRLRDTAVRFLHTNERPHDATRAAPLDPILLFEGQAIHRAARACHAAKARARDRQISMPGSFELLSDVSQHLVQALHPLSTDVSTREAVVARAKERVADFLASMAVNAAEEIAAPR